MLTIPTAYEHNMQTIERHRQTINRSIQQREENERSNIILALEAGEALTELKKMITHGNWQNWVLHNTGYKTMRHCQMDMRLWKAWGKKVKDNPNFVKRMSGEDVSLTLSAMRDLSRRNVPERAIEFAIKRITTAKQLPDTDNIVEATSTIDMIGDETRQNLAQQLYEKGLQNVSVIKMLDRIDTDTLSEMVNSGTMYVPEVGQKPLSDISTTDVEMRVDKNAREAVMSERNQYKKLDDQKKQQKREFKFLEQVDGTREELIAALQELDESGDYRINLFARR